MTAVNKSHDASISLLSQISVNMLTEGFYRDLGHTCCQCSRCVTQQGDQFILNNAFQLKLNYVPSSIINSSLNASLGIQFHTICYWNVSIKIQNVVAYTLVHKNNHAIMDTWRCNGMEYIFSSPRKQCTAVI